MKKLTHYLALAAAFAGFSQIAQAVPMLKLFDGTTTIIITDNVGIDLDGTSGRILFNGTIGNWTITTDVGSTFPVIGTLSKPQLDLSFNAVSNAGGGTLVITFSADGFGPTGNAFSSSIGGTTQGTVSTAAFGGTNNTVFSVVAPLTSQGPFTGAFSGSVNSPIVTNAGPYALTQQITITHAGAGITTGDALLSSVPDSGTSVLLLGVGLMLLALAARVRPLLLT
jgi:hypothetical protein